MRIYKLEILDQYSKLIQVQAPQGSQALADPKPEYFADEQSLNEALKALSIDPSKGLDNGDFVSHKSQLGTFVVSTFEAKESAKAAVSE